MKSDSKHVALPNIVLVTGSLEGGGAERSLADMANYWGGKGWCVTLATWSGPETKDFYRLAPNVSRAWLNVNSSNKTVFSQLRTNVGRVFKLRRLIRALRPDAVLSFIDVSNVLTILATYGVKVRVVVSERGCPDQTAKGREFFWTYSLSSYWRLLRKLLYRQADVVTALNLKTAMWIKKVCRTEARVIPVALRLLPEPSGKREPFILAVGRLHAVKGFDLLLKAFAKISVDCPGWNLVVIGDGPERGSLKILCEKLHLGGRVEFLKPVKDIEDWMARAGIVVLPSRFEAFGNTVLESLGMGAPVITTNCSGPSSFIKDRVNGCLVPVEDIAALAQVMAELIANPDLRKRLGHEALRVRETHHQDMIMLQWETYLFPDLEGRRTKECSMRAFLE